MIKVLAPSIRQCPMKAASQRTQLSNMKLKKCFYKLLMSCNLVKILHALVFLSMGFLIDNLLLQLFYI